MTTHEAEVVCPFCGTANEAATNAEPSESSPLDGDVSLCFQCGKFSLFDRTARGGMRKPTKQQQRQIDADPRVQQLKSAWRQVKQ